MRGAGRILPYAAGAGLAYGGYENVQDINRGNVGSGVGGLAGGGVGMAVGAAIGSLTGWFTGPFGALIGGVLGQQLGTYIGGMVSPGGSGRMAGPGGPSMAMADRNAGYQDSSLSLMGKLLVENETSNSFLSQIKAELARQSAALTGVPSPVGAPAAGMGLSAPNIQSFQGRGGRPDASTPYSGP